MANWIEGPMYWSIPMATRGIRLLAEANRSNGMVVMGPPSASSPKVLAV